MTFVARRGPLRPARCKPGTTLSDAVISGVEVGWRPRRVLADLTLARCTLEDVHIGTPRAHLRNLLHVRRLCVKDLVFRYPTPLLPTFWDECVFDGVRVSRDVVMVSGVFRHCVLRGRIGLLLFMDDVMNALGGPSGRARGPFAQPVDAARARETLAYYRDLDWALDIRGAEFVTPMSFPLPGRLVRYDPRTQLALSRKEVRAFVAKSATVADALPIQTLLRALGPNPWASSLSLLLGSPFESKVLAAAATGKDRGHWLDGLRELRKLGLAEPAPARRGSAVQRAGAATVVQAAASTPRRKRAKTAAHGPRAR